MAEMRQSEIARILGISNNQLKRITHAAKIRYQVINGHRYFDFQEVLAAIQRGREVHREINT